MPAIFLSGSLLASAQEEGKTKVHLKVRKNEVVTLDTTLYVKSGSDSDELKSLIHELAEIDDFDLHIMGEKGHYFLGHHIEKTGSDSVKTVVVTVDDDEHINIKIDKEDVKAFAIVSGDDEIVIKKKDGKVIIMEGDDIRELHAKDIFIEKDKEGDEIDIYLKKGDDGTVLVKKKVTVIKKKEEGEEEREIEIIIEEKENKEEKAAKEKKTEKEKKLKEAE